MKRRSGGTILLWTENVTPNVLTHEAINSGYFPEWLNMASTWQTNAGAEPYSQQNWRHAMSVSSLDLPRPPGYDDCSVAYRSQDPDNAPRQCWMFRALQQFANGIQLAGPKLTPQTFFQGLKKMPCRPPVPEWSIGGCYGDDDGGREPNGAFRFVHGGSRFKVGEVPAQSPWFKEGITTPADPVQHG